MTDKKVNNKGFNLFVLGMFIGTILLFGVALLFGEIGGIHLSHQSANKVCQELTNNSNAYAVDWQQTNFNGNYVRKSLICKLPTYDHTNLITIQKG